MNVPMLPATTSFNLSRGFLTNEALVMYNGYNVRDLNELCNEVCGIIHFIGNDTRVRLKSPLSIFLPTDARISFPANLNKDCTLESVKGIPPFFDPTGSR